MSRDVSFTGCVDDGGECGAACMEDTGEMQKHWTYVGEGRGNYQKVEKYMQVAGGAYTITEVPQRRISPACCCWCTCILSLTILLVLAFFLRGPISSVVGSVGSDIVSRDTYQYVPPMYDCSVGTWMTNLRSDVDAATREFRGKAFKDSDTDFNGLLSPAELSAASSKLPSCFAQHALQWDQDGNGLSLGEMEAGLAAEASVKSHHMLMEPEKTGAVADLDCDGYLSVSELAILNESPLPQHTKDLLIAGDVDADGKLGSTEMIAALQKSMVATNPSASNRVTAEIWNETKRTWCCNFEQLGCATHIGHSPEPESCNAGQVLTWSAAKKQRCCASVGLGCQDQPSADCAISPGVHPEDWSKEKRADCCKHHGVLCDVDSYDCMAGLTNWLAGWHPDKKKWCCDHKQLGCVDSQYNCSSDSAAWSAKQRTYCCSSYHKGCGNATIPKPEFNCHEGWPDHADNWTHDKKEFCCSNYARGCKVGSPVSPASPHPHPHPYPQIVTPTHYDCQSGLSSWKTLWPPAKAIWCCAHRDLGCSQHGHFDCDAGSVKSWPSAKQDYCCLYHEKGCQFNVHHSTHYVYSDDAYTPGHSDYVTTDDHSYQYPSSYPYSYSDSDGYSSTPAVDDGALQLGNLDGSKSFLDKAAGDSVLPHAVTSVSEHVHSHTAVKLAHAVTHVSEHATGHQAAHVGHDARTVRSQHEEKVSSEGAAAHEMTGHAHAKEELASEEKHTHAEAGTTLKASTTLKAATTTLAAVMFGGGGASEKAI